MTTIPPTVNAADTPPVSGTPSDDLWAGLGRVWGWTQHVFSAPFRPPTEGLGGRDYTFTLGPFSDPLGIEAIGRAAVATHGTPPPPPTVPTAPSE